MDHHQQPQQQQQIVTRQRKAKAMTTAMKKKQPVKVVYISNPMKVKTSVSEFRALVQELTGQDSDLADYKFSDHDYEGTTANTTTAIATTTTTTPDDDDDKVGDEFVEEIVAVENYDGYWRSSHHDDEYYSSLDQGFDIDHYNHYHHEENQGFSSSQTMVENLNGFFHCSAVLFEAPHHRQVVCHEHNV